MKIKHKKLFIIAILLLINVSLISAQNKVWSLKDCINYALNENINIRKSNLSVKESEIRLSQSKTNRIPTLNGSASTTYSWAKEQMTESNSFGDKSRKNISTFGLSSGTTLYNGGKLKNKIKEADVNYKGEQYSSETQKEFLQLNILNAYLEILYSEENVKNDSSRIKKTQEELNLAKERMNTGLISLSDYLEIKSEISAEKSTLAEDMGIMATNKVTLMQLMELPVITDFNIESPDLNDIIDSYYGLTANSVQIYQQALKVKPQIKLAALNVESAKINEKITKADLYPTLSLNAGLQTGWTDQISNFSYSEQLKNQYTPSVGLKLSIPIFQNKQAKNNIKLAQLSTEEYKLDETDTKNALRKNIEQASVDLKTSQVKYETSKEAYNSAKESYDVALEKFNQGIINSVDFITIKSNLTEAENNLLKQKFNLVYNNKKLDFYKGESISSLK